MQFLGNIWRALKAAAAAALILVSVLNDRDDVEFVTFLNKPKSMKAVSTNFNPVCRCSFYLL
jgi:hypothetical protein